MEEWVSLVDIAPTLIELLEWDVSQEDASGFEGRSLASYFRGEAMAPRAVFAESGRSYFPKHVRDRVRFDIDGRFRAAWMGDWKLIWTPFAPADEEYQLYNMERDPQERENLAERAPEKVSELRAELAAWLQRQTGTNPNRELSPEETELLRSLGYIE